MLESEIIGNILWAQLGLLRSQALKNLPNVALL